MSIEGFNLIRKRVAHLSKLYQVIIDDPEFVDIATACQQLSAVADLLQNEQFDDAVIMMPPGTHLERVK